MSKCVELKNIRNAFLASREKFFNECAAIARIRIQLSIDQITIEWISREETSSTLTFRYSREKGNLRKVSRKKDI